MYMQLVWDYTNGFSITQSDSGTINFVCVQVCESREKENPIHCEWHTFWVLRIFSTYFPLEFM